MKRVPTNNRRRRTGGFVILYAVLVAGVVSLGGVLLANIIVKQLILSSIGRESQISYYAANAGVECARYGYVSDSFGVYGEPGGPRQNSPLSCASEGEVSGDLSADGDWVYEFEVDPDPADQQVCAQVKVALTPERPVFTSIGISRCDDDTHPRRTAKEIYRVGRAAAAN